MDSRAVDEAVTQLMTMVTVVEADCCMQVANRFGELVFDTGPTNIMDS